MKIFYSLLTIILMSSTISNAQQLDESWFLKAGVSYIELVDFEPEEDDVGEEGVDQVWDFSAANPEPFIQNEINIVAAEDGLFNDSIPSANYCKISDGPFFYEEYYYSQDADSLKEMAYIFQQAADDPSFNPLNYNLLVNGFSLGDTLWRDETKDAYFYFDGIGTVITPEGTFENCIRIKFEIFFGNLITFLWYQNDFSHPVLEVSPLKFDPIFGSDFGFVKFTKDYQDNSISSNNSVNQLKNISVRSQNGTLFIENNASIQNLECSIFELDGRKLVEQSLSIKNAQHSILLPEFSNGSIVVVLLVDKQSGAFYSQKILVRE